MSAAVLWSGGKDCFAAGLRSGALEEAGTRLVTFVPAGEAVAFRCHPLGVMRRQAAGLGLRHELVAIERDGWEASYRRGARGVGGGRRGAGRHGRHHAAGVAVAGGRVRSDGPRAGDAARAAPGDDAGVLLDFLAADGVEATVAGMRAEHYRAGFLGRPIGHALLAAHGLDDPAAFHPCGERGEYHTVVTAYRGTRFVEEDPSAFAHVERDGIWALDWPAIYTSDFH